MNAVWFLRVPGVLSRKQAPRPLESSTLLTETVRRFIDRHALLAEGDRLAVAYSGGPDSTCALLVLRDIWKDTSAIYVNHQLRGEESAAEERFVTEFCRKRAIPLFIEHIRWGSKPSNLEEQARKRRYRHLAKVALEQGFDKVALGHHLGDVAETFLLRLIRGSGPAGLAGPAPRRGRYIRPLLSCSRREILEFLSSRDARYFTDTSNTDLAFHRNRLRTELIPYVEKHFNTAFVKNLARTADWIREQDQAVAHLLEPYTELIAASSGRVSIARSELLALPEAIRKLLLRKALRLADPSLTPSALSLARMLAAIDRQENMELPGFLMVESSQNSIDLVHKTGAPGYFELDVPGPGRYSFAPAKVALDFEISGNTSRLQFVENRAYLDAGRASFPLYIRNWKKGDSFVPLGMAGHKKLSDYFVDHKVPREQRKRIPLVFKDDRLVWVGGYQIDNDFRVVEGTEKVLKIELHAENA